MVDEVQEMVNAIEGNFNQLNEHIDEFGIKHISMPREDMADFVKNNMTKITELRIEGTKRIEFCCLVLYMLFEIVKINSEVSTFQVNNKYGTFKFTIEKLAEPEEGVGKDE